MNKYRVLITILNRYREVEYEKKIYGNTWKGVRRKATNWINKNLLDVKSIEKGTLGLTDFWDVK
jgi:hypothetical protein